MLIKVPKPAGWQRAILWLAATRPGSWLLSKILAPLDALTLRLSRHRRSLVSILAGLPTIELTTYGAVTGRSRVCTLIPIPDGPKLVVIATNFGAKRHPSWYYNLTANPEVLVSLANTTAKYSARPAAEDERARYWRQAVAMYRGYSEYAGRAGGRRIPIIVLEPEQPPAESPQPA